MTKHRPLAACIGECPSYNGGCWIRLNQLQNKQVSFTLLRDICLSLGAYVLFLDDLTLELYMLSECILQMYKSILTGDQCGLNSKSQKGYKDVQFGFQYRPLANLVLGL